MTKKLFTIRDSKGEIYNNPFTALTHADAERTFGRAATDPQSQISMYPEDFDLFFLGEYNDQTGTISALETPQHIMKALHHPSLKNRNSEALNAKSHVALQN